MGEGLLPPCVAQWRNPAAGRKKMRAADPNGSPRASHDVQPTYHRTGRVPHGTARPDNAMVGYAPPRPATTGLPVPTEKDATKVTAETRLP